VLQQSVRRERLVLLLVSLGQQLPLAVRQRVTSPLLMLLGAVSQTLKYPGLSDEASRSALRAVQRYFALRCRGLWLF
jgi:hypothetical protein